MSVSRLPLRVAPIKGETLPGFMIRLAERNGVSRPQTIAKALGSPYSTLQAAALKPFDLQSVADGAGVPIERLASLTYWPTGNGNELRFLEVTVNAEMISLKHRFACPECLSEAEFHRAIWDLSLVSACPKHERLLVDRCRECGSNLRWNTASLVRCECGADIRKIPRSGVAPAALHGLSYVHSVLNAQGKFDVGPFSALRFCDQLSLMYEVGWLASGARNPPGPVKLVRGIFKPHQILQFGYQACSAWPVSFYRCLDGMLWRSGVRNWGANRIRNLAEWAIDPGRSRELKKLLVRAFRGYMKIGCPPVVERHFQRVLQHDRVQ